MAFDPPWFKSSASFGRKQYDLAAPLVLTLLPAGHPPGQYMMTCTQFVTTAGASGTLGYSLGWDQPNFGAATLNIGNANINATGLASTTQRSVESTGVSALTATFTPNSPVGSPKMHVNVSAMLVGPAVPT